MADVFTALGEPRRRRLVEELSVGPASVTELVRRLDLPQPTVSKHLRTLRDAGLVRVQIDAQRRIYSLDSRPLQELDDWIERHRRLWSAGFDALGRHLDATASNPAADSHGPADQPRHGSDHKEPHTATPRQPDPTPTRGQSRPDTGERL